MANVLSDEKRQQVAALGRLGWSLRRIQRETGVRRETASAYLKAAGVDVRGHGGAKPKPATSGAVITDKPGHSAGGDHRPDAGGGVKSGHFGGGDHRPGAIGAVADGERSSKSGRATPSA
jgi:hypothetical protein